MSCLRHRIAVRFVWKSSFDDTYVAQKASKFRQAQRTQRPRSLGTELCSLFHRLSVYVSLRPASTENRTNCSLVTRVYRRGDQAGRGVVPTGLPSYLPKLEPIGAENSGGVSHPSEVHSRCLAAHASEPEHGQMSSVAEARQLAKARDWKARDEGHSDQSIAMIRG